jgi:ArsR family transcriptional regulator
MSGPSLLEPSIAEHAAVLLRAIAHPVRLRVLAVLRQGEANVSQLTDRLGVPQAVVSNQLAILRMNGLVEVRRAGGFAWYSLNPSRLCEAVGCLDGRRDGLAADSAAQEAR